MFSLLLLVALMKHAKKIDPLEWRFLLAGPTNTTLRKPNPAPSWCTEKVRPLNIHVHPLNIHAQAQPRAQLVHGDSAPP
eukprot:1191862-Prorocentrum_minimum.AAC.1